MKKKKPKFDHARADALILDLRVRFLEAENARLSALLSIYQGLSRIAEGWRIPPPATIDHTRNP